jgi:hypothetical protein
MKIWSRFVIALVIAAGVGILRVPILQAVTAAYQETVRIVDSAGNVINGTASAVTANYQKTVRVVDSNGHVLDAFGGSSSTGYTANGGITSTGSILVSPVTIPAAPSIVSGFTAGTTDYYYCAAGDINANTTNGLGITPLGSPTGTTATTGTMSCPGETGALKLYLLRYTANTVPTGAQSVLVASCTVASGTGCNLSDAANSPTSFYVQGTTGNGTEYFKGGSLVLGPSQIAQDGINVFMANNSTGNPLVDYYNGTAVTAISSKGQFFSQPTDTATTEFQANGPSGQSANLLDLKVNSVSKFTIDQTGTVTAGSLKWVWLGGSNATLSNSGVTYFSINGLSPAASAGTFGNIQTISSGSYVIANLHCVLMTSGGVVTVAGGTSYVIAVQKNASVTSETCTIATAASSCSDTTPGDAVSVAANDALFYVATPSGTPTALEAKCSVEVHG